MCICAFQCVVNVLLARKGSSVLFQQLEFGADGSVVFMSRLSVLCVCSGSVLFELWLSVLCGFGGMSWRKSMGW